MVLEEKEGVVTYCDDEDNYYCSVRETLAHDEDRDSPGGWVDCCGTEMVEESESLLFLM